MSIKEAILAYIQLQEYMNPSVSASTKAERTKNSVAFKREFIKILRSVGMDEDSRMQQTAVEAWTSET
jgi:hypothetical protein